MNRAIRVLAAGAVSVLGLWLASAERAAGQVASAQARPAATSAASSAVRGPKTRQLTAQEAARLEALVKALPEYEKAADEAEPRLKPFLASSSPKVSLAADSALLCIRAIRGCRAIVNKDPGYVYWHVGPASLAKYKLGLEYYLDCAKTGKDPFQGMVKGVRPFRTRTDGQLLIYILQLPKAYDPTKKYPLAVDLHFGGGFSWLAGWVDGKPSADERQASNDGAIHISPAGRQHGGTGERAVLDAIDDARRHYAVDEDRIRIGGASYGGSGGYHFAAFFPDLFAGAWSLTGGGNYGYVPNNGLWDAYMLGDNLCSVGWLTWDTPGDGHYKANRAFADGLCERAAKHPGFYPNLELTDPKGAHGIIKKDLLAQGNAWLAKQVRNRWPKLVIYKTYGLRYDGAYWARIDTFEDYTKPARIEAEVSVNGANCRVAIENVDRFHLELDPQLVGKAAHVQVSVASGQPLKIPTGKTAYFAKTDGKWAVSAERYPAGLIKKHGLSGPMQDALQAEPFVFVYGTADGKDKAAAEKVVESVLAPLFGTGDGSGFLREDMKVKADADVTDVDIAEKHLVLIGTPAQNRLTARIADKLPVKFLADGYALGGKEYREKGLILAMIYPNPLNPQRYVLLLSEDHVRRLWEYPDYIILLPSQGGAGHVRAKGTFDNPGAAGILVRHDLLPFRFEFEAVGTGLDRPFKDADQFSKRLLGFVGVFWHGCLSPRTSMVSRWALPCRFRPVTPCVGADPVGIYFVQVVQGHIERLGVFLQAQQPEAGEDTGDP